MHLSVSVSVTKAKTKTEMLSKYGKMAKKSEMISVCIHHGKSKCD